MLSPSVCLCSLISKNQNASAVKKSTYTEYLLNGIGGYLSNKRRVFHENSGFRGCFNNWILLATLLFFLVPTIALAAQATLEWVPDSQSPEGYYVFQRVEGGAYNYSNPVWPIDGKDHTETSCTIEGLTEGVTYYFVVRAYLGSIVSADSNEESYKVPLSLPAIHTISASSGANGNINPSAGDISVNHGDSQTFYFVPDSGYEISVVTVDGQSIGSPSSYTFSNVIQDHSIAVAYTELLGQDTPQANEQDIPQANEQDIWFEAEDGDIYSPIVIADDPKASEGGYIHAPVGSVAFVNSPSAWTGRAEYAFEVPSTGDYVVWGRVNAISSRRDSFYVAMDGGSYLTWHVLRTATDSWAWDVVCQRAASDPRDVTDEPFIYHLQAGFHKLTFATREAGTKLDRILITSVAGDIPTDIPSQTDEPSGTSVISKTDWRLVSVDSEELVGEDGAAVNAFDDDPGTIWHTQWADASPTHPHELVIDLGNTCQLDGFSMLPRQDGSANGRIIDYAFYIGDHPDQWSTPVAAGRFANTSTEKSVTFSSAAGRYIRLVALSESYGNPWTSVAEISVTGPVR